jgi:hypothetical protein
MQAMKLPSIPEKSLAAFCRETVETSLLHIFLLSGAYKLGFPCIDVMWCHHACFWINQEKPTIILK